MHPSVNIAIKAARAAAKIMLQNFDRPHKLRIERKSDGNFVTQVDKLCEQEIKDVLLQSYPDYGFLAEEGGQEGNSNPQWIIDPLDGTNNYIHGIPHFAISIALHKDNHLESAVIYNPILDELFAASRNQGVLLNNRRFQTSTRKTLDDALLGMGSPNHHSSLTEAYNQQVASLQQKVGSFRRSGSSVLDLAYVACGRLDGFWDLQAKPWDIAAGKLLIQEVGGVASDFTQENTRSFVPHAQHILACNRALHPQLAPLLADAMPKSD